MRTIKLYTILLAVLAVTACSQKEDLEEVQYKTATLSFSSGMSGLVTEGRADGEFVSFTATVTDAAGAHNGILFSQDSRSCAIKVYPNKETTITVTDITAAKVEVDGLSASPESYSYSTTTSGGNASMDIKFIRQYSCITLGTITVAMPGDENAEFSPSYIGIIVDGTHYSNNDEEELQCNFVSGKSAEIVMGGKLTFCGKDLGTRYYRFPAETVFEMNTKYTVTATIIGEGSGDKENGTPSSYIKFELNKTDWNVIDWYNEVTKRV